ncbi:MAG: hydantoinase/oxoprolinase family protein [Gammaproteobacteria bacterium]|nr:hydantoinase/oxoprolinase family protein [Gammaproteobacteria bacterium]
MTGRIAVDIGGTFTDVALETPDGTWVSKVLTTQNDPARGALAGIEQVLHSSGVAPSAVRLVIHGTTLATNAIIERRGARTALITTDGFRDAVEMGYENRFEQYDIDIVKPSPLVPRRLRMTVKERISAAGNMLVPLDLASVDALLPALVDNDIESVAIGLIHSYAFADNEYRIAERLRAALPELSITCSADVCPEIREYERLSTACANAYVQPLVERYLRSLESLLTDRGFNCPLLLMTSAGGLTTVDTAVRHPIRLLESGPAGGAMLAADIARRNGLDDVLAFDMGGTTAKLCLIERGQPRSARHFEVDRVYRFSPGSGLPLRVPVIDMVEIGAGGGSIATLNVLQHIQVGPLSAGSEPGPACYGRGGRRPTVTDADVLLGRVDSERFAGGSLALDTGQANHAVYHDISIPLQLDTALAAFGISEVVEENMASAARVHAVERGRHIGHQTMIAFGGAGPLHAARLATKLGIDRVVIPAHASVGSAIGFLRAPVAFDVVRSHYVQLGEFDPMAINAMFDAMRSEAESVVHAGAPGADVTETRSAFMRYIGQGHEIEVHVPLHALTAADADTLRANFDATYAQQYDRSIPDQDVEILTWSLRVCARSPDVVDATNEFTEPRRSDPIERPVFNPETNDYEETPVYERGAMQPEILHCGPALIAEDQTTTDVPASFSATADDSGNLLLTRIATTS